MTLIIDASVASKWFVRETGSDRAAELLQGGEAFLAPDILIAEVTNVLWLNWRAGRIQRTDVEAGLDLLPRHFEQLVAATRLAQRAFAIAAEIDHPVYDCLYLALAESADSRLVSADQRLAAKLKGTSWARRVAALSR